MRCFFYNLDVLFSGGKFSILLSKDFFTNSLTRDPRMHSHAKHELQFVESGRCVLHSDVTSLECEAGDILLIPAGIEHKIQYAEGTETRSFLFYPHKDYKQDALFSALCVRRPALVRGYVGAKDRLFCIGRLLEEGTAPSDERARGELTLFLAELCDRLLPRGEACRPPHQENRAEEIENYIGACCYSPDCTCENLAKHLNLSKRQVHRLCIEYYGIPFRTLLHNSRMDIARHRLDSSHVSVTELAELLGYASAASFSAAYKRHFGKPPTGRI